MLVRNARMPHYTNTVSHLITGFLIYSSIPPRFCFMFYDNYNNNNL